VSTHRADAKDIFVTGGTGYLGVFLIKALLEDGHRLTVLARNPRKIADLVGVRGVSFLEGGLDEIQHFRSSLGRFSVCIHNAIIWDDSKVDLDLRDTRASLALFEAAANSGVQHMIYTSSTAVHRPFRSRMDEQTVLTPDDDYGAMKACSELFLSAISYQYPMRCTVVRPGPIVGPPIVPGAPFKTDHRFLKFVRAARAGETLRVRKNDGRQFVAATDLAKFYSVLVRSDTSRETFLVVAREVTTWEQIANDVVLEVGSASRVIVEDPKVETALFDVAKIERHFGLRFNAGPAVRAHIRHVASLES